MIKVLVATPTRPGQHPFLAACSAKLRAGFPLNNPGFSFDFQETDKDYRQGRTRLAAIAAARYELVDQITDHDYVLMLDSDLVMVPFDLPIRLQEANPDGITAPLALIEGMDQFYDTSGFIENGECVSHLPPFFSAHGDLIDLDSVGSAYLVPADVYSDIRYPDEPSWLTDHWEFCQAAKAAGWSVRCLRTLAVHHAILPLYGEQWREKGT